MWGKSRCSECHVKPLPGLELPGGGGGQRGSTPQLSFQPPYSLLFFNYHDFSRALLTIPVIFSGIPTLATSKVPSSLGYSAPGVSAALHFVAPPVERLLVAATIVVSMHSAVSERIVGSYPDQSAKAAGDFWNEGNGHQRLNFNFPTSHILYLLRCGVPKFSHLTL